MSVPLISLSLVLLLFSCAEESGPKHTKKLANDEDATAQYNLGKQICWSIKGDGISIKDHGKKMVRTSKHEKRFCGARSKNPIPTGEKINLKIESKTGKMFTYFGVTSGDVLVDNYVKKRPNKWCIYFSDGNNWSGMHDSEFKKSNLTDWRPQVVPPVKSSETISLSYYPEQKRITFHKDNEIVYTGKGFEGDLFLFAAVNYPNESVTILE